MKKLILILIITLSLQLQASADELIMARSTEDFPETMLLLQTTIKNLGYRPSRVQRVDIGLTKSGYATDKYRVVFFGKADEIKMVSEKLPELIPYLPLKISIFAEDGQTIIVTLNPLSFDSMFPNSGLQSTFKQWDKDIREIFKRIQNIK
jgi:uncharacterized protein (DUF302 family)